MKKSKMIVARNSNELAEALNLSPADAVEWEVRSILNEKIIQLVDDSGITHAHLAKLAGTSRPRITALLNRRRRDISTDLMFRVLASLGYSPKLSFRKVAG
jgi:plasmid maintenance system antidote protein VapI